MLDFVLPNKKESFDGYGLKRGIVNKIVQDKDKKFNMLEVNIVGEEHIVTGVKVLSRVAHKKSGDVFLPSIGDEVLIGYINNDLTQPVALGSLYNAVNEQFNKHLVANEENNNFNSYISLPVGKASDGKEGGLKIEISCEADKQKIILTTQHGHTVTLDDEKDKEKVEIKKKDGKDFFLIDFKNGEITLQAEKKITLKAGNEDSVELDKGKGLTISCGSKNAVDAKAKDIKCKANANVNIEGSQIAIKGNSQAKLSATNANVEANAMLTLKGNMTKIN